MDKNRTVAGLDVHKDSIYLGIMSAGVSDSCEHKINLTVIKLSKYWEWHGWDFHAIDRISTINSILTTD